MNLVHTGLFRKKNDLFFRKSVGDYLPKTLYILLLYEWNQREHIIWYISGGYIWDHDIELHTSDPAG